MTILIIGVIMLKKIVSKKSIVIAVIVICCLTVFAIIIGPNKMSYSVEEANDKYIVSIKNNWGEKIYEEEFKLEPIILQIGKDTILIKVGGGDSWKTKFVNGKTNRISDSFENISAFNEQFVVYGIYEDGQLKIVIRDIYDKDKFYKEIIDTFPDVAVGSYIIKDAQFVDNDYLYLNYYVGNEWEEKEEMILLR